MLNYPSKAFRIADEVTRPMPAMTPPAMTPPPRRRPRRFAAFCIAVAVIFAGVYAVGLSSGQPATETVTVPLGLGSVTTTIAASGNVRPVGIVRVSTLQGGTLVEIPVDFNSEVHKGDLLARIDDATQRNELRRADAEVASAIAMGQVEDGLILQREAEARAAEAQGAAALAASDAAEAELKLAASSLDRSRLLQTGGVASLSAVQAIEASHNTALARLRQARSAQDQAAALAKAAEAALGAARAQRQTSVASLEQALARQERARIDQERTMIRSPVDGTVVWKAIDVGQTVSTNVEPPVLFFIAKDLAEVQIETTIDENDIARLRPGQRVGFTVAAYPGRSFEGRVKQIRSSSEGLFGSRQETASAVTYIVEIGTSNDDRRLLPGMTASVRIVTAEARNALTVPTAALRYGESFVARNEVTIPDGAAGMRPLVVRDGAGAMRILLVSPIASDGNSTAVRTNAPWTTEDQAIVAERPASHD